MEEQIMIKLRKENRKEQLRNAGMDTSKYFEFKVNQAHVGNFNFVPAAEYTYVEGDELKLVCLNEGYETYWDSETNTFRLRDIIQKVILHLIQLDMPRIKMMEQ